MANAVTDPRGGSQAKPTGEARGEALIGGQYAVDFSRPVQAGGGMPAFVAEDRGRRGGGLIAIQTRLNLPPRVRSLATLSVNPADRVLNPVAHGALEGRGDYFVIAQAPLGPSLAAQRRVWSEPELLEQVLRPAVQALESLQSRRVMHRAIRPDMLFHAGLGDPVMLGCAWVAPGAALQPVVFEPPYVAVCPPAMRGEGNVADDIYALGVTLLTLALGRVPLADLSDAEIVRRKLDLGSYAALVGAERLPSVISDLLRGMLAEDPDHRPTPALLLDPATARSRRVAARPPRRASRSLEVDGVSVWDARSLAQALGQRPERGGQLLRLGVVDHWLRRIVGDTTMALRLEEITRRDEQQGSGDSLADAFLVMRAAATLDPMAPLWWQGVPLWQDAVPTALADAICSGSEGRNWEELVDRQAFATWGETRPERGDPAALRLEARQQRAQLHLSASPLSVLRLAYALNPLLSCQSRLLTGSCITRINELLPVLDRLATQMISQAGTSGAGIAGPVDAHIAAFVAARSDISLPGELIAGLGVEGERLAINRLRSFAALQVRYGQRPLPGLARWLVGSGNLAASRWRSRSRQTQLRAEIEAAAEAGMLLQILELLEDEAEREAGLKAAEAARDQLGRIDAELRLLGNGDAPRMAAARRTGREIAVACGICALAFAGLAAL